MTKIQTGHLGQLKRKVNRKSKVRELPEADKRLARARRRIEDIQEQRAFEKEWEL